jgi:hypothetical protein
MDGNQVRDFADRVKNFYYYRALLCEKLITTEVAIQGNSVGMPPQEFNPFNNLSVDAYVIGCAAIEALSSIWQAFSTPTKAKSHNQQRFVSFLLHLKIDKYLDRVSTPFLNYFLEKQGIEEPFRQEINNRWLNNRDKRESHRVYSDPSINELKDVYNTCHQNNSIPPQQTIKDIDDVLRKFTYAALIYKYYRCSFIHEFRYSKYVTSFNAGNQISVRQFAVDILPSEGLIRRDEVKPQLDVGIGVLVESIRKGADVVSNLIVERQLTDIPYSSTDEIKFNIKTKV